MPVLSPLPGHSSQSARQGRGIRRSAGSSRGGRLLLRWLPASVAVGAILALAIGSVPAAFAADPSPIIVQSGTATVQYSIVGGSSGTAIVVNPRHPAWSTIAGTEWINPSGLATCHDPACGTLIAPKTAMYTTSFNLPAVSSASITVEILADNSAVSVALNTVQFGAQGDVLNPNPNPANFTTPSTFTYGIASTFNAGVNTLSIQNKDYGVADGIDFKATVTYIPAPLVISFVTPSSKTYDGNTDAGLTSCSVAPATAGLTCVPVTGAHADLNNKHVGTAKPVLADLTDFTLTGPFVAEYTNRTVAPATADITPAPLTVTAVANVKVADGNTSAAAIPTVTGSTYDGAAFSETYDTPAAGSGKTLTPAGVMNDGNGGNDYSYVFVPVAPGQIQPAAVATIVFTTQPIDTQVSTPIYSFCAPPASGTLPCAAAPTSTPIKVTARDAFGNLAGPGSPGADGTTAAVTITIKETGQAATLGTASSSNGLASFGDSLVIGATRASTTLAASAAPSATATSTSFQVISDVAACDGTICDTLATGGPTGQTQTTFGRIKTDADFFNENSGENVLLTTQFVPWQGGQCATPTNKLGLTADIRVQGTGVSPTSPDFFVTLVYPKATLASAGLAAKPALAFDVCLGATWLDAGAPVAWKAKPLTFDLLQDSKPETGPGANPNVYWGWAPLCLRINLSPALSAQQKATNPCVVLKTKSVAALRAELVGNQGLTLAQFNAIGAKDNDVMIVISKPWPWDGKFGTGLK